jgi:large subunit ribosomal protein L21
MLRLTRASAIGSREYTFRGAPWVDERRFVCRARVVGVESEPMRRVEKTKRRQRHVKTVRSKHRFTVVRCCELRVLTEVREDENGGGEGGGSVVREGLEEGFMG